MGLYYNCRHCHTCIGIINEEDVSPEALGLHGLSPSEQNEHLRTDYEGNTNVTVICEHCEEAMRLNPVLHGLDYIIQ